MRDISWGVCWPPGSRPTTNTRYSIATLRGSFIWQKTLWQSTMKPETREPSEVASVAVEIVPLQQAREPRQRASFTPRAILLSALLAGLGISWAIQNSLITQTVYVGGSVPPIPVVAILFAAAAVNPWLRDRRLSQSEILLR